MIKSNLQSNCLNGLCMTNDLLGGFPAKEKPRINDNLNGIGLLLYSYENLNKAVL